MSEKDQAETAMAEQTKTTNGRWRSRAAGRGVLLSTMAVSGALGFFLAPAVSAPQERTITVVARKYAYEPAVIRVNRGDTVRLRFASSDMVHGFYLEGHDMNVKIHPMRSTVELFRDHASEPEEVEEVVFTADREGKFRYRCSQTCGYLHPFMLGELIVAPNRLFPTGVGLAIGMLLGGFFIVRLRGDMV
ncbi:MAG: hypothetical protein BMS9Abin37_2870 [Acidobacteriota bacterium]|nr:MAG: hypothetical protein BMS9Abin37_2870 [Acidobacteriota bacterium]